MVKQKTPGVKGSDEINHPAHYTDECFDFEVIEMIERIWGKEALRLHCQMNAFEYRMRAGKKGQTSKEISKAEWYEAKARNLKQDNAEGGETRLDLKDFEKLIKLIKK